MSTSRRFGHLQAWPAGSADDAGFSLVELMTAMAIFVSLMAIVSAAMVAVFGGIKDSMAKSEQQADAQLAAEWISKAVRYAVAPEGVGYAIDNATSTSIKFYTMASLGTRGGIPYNDVPYLVEISAVTQANGQKWIVAKQWSPTKATGGWTWPAAGSPSVTRTLLRMPASSSSPLGIAVQSCDSTVTGSCTGAGTAVTLPMTSTTIVAPVVPYYVQFTVGNTNDPRNVIRQRVRLVNFV